MACGVLQQTRFIGVSPRAALVVRPLTPPDGGHVRLLSLICTHQSASGSGWPDYLGETEAPAGCVKPRLAEPAKREAFVLPDRLIRECGKCGNGPAW